MSSVKQDMFLLDCPTYQEYLDTFITPSDIRFLRNMRFCRQLVELGYRSGTEMYSPEEYEKRKAAAQESLWPKRKASILFSENMSSTDPCLMELARREQLNVEKIISTIIFTKYRLPSGFEISGYIDYEQSLRESNLKLQGCIDWSGVFSERIILRPRRTDLSFFNWHKGKVFYNDSENFVVVHDVRDGLIFMHRGDHKKICVDSKRKKYAENSTRAMHFSDKYGHLVFYDHIVRRKI